ncbi:MAG: Gldg family protein [Rhodospirillales bacterium]
MTDADGGRPRTWAALGLLAVLFFSVNVMPSVMLRDARIDMTEDRLFTVSDGARAVLSAIDEPVHIRLYYSPALGDASPAFAAYYQRVRELLLRYADAAKGGLVAEFLNLEPFSDVEDRAVGSGLRGEAVNETGDLVYFGVTAVNSTDDIEVIPFLNFERERFLEYDLMRMIASLAEPEKPAVGLISSLPVMGGGRQSLTAAPSQRWAVIDAIEPFYEVRDLGADFHSIDADIRVLLMIHPKDLPDAALYAIDQFVMNGGRVLAFIDPNTEVAQLTVGPEGPRKPEASSLGPLLAAWGVLLEEKTVAADMDAARRVSLNADGRGRAADYVAWLELGPENGDPNDVVAGAFTRLFAATAGVLRQTENAETAFTPLLWTGARSMRLDVEAVRGDPDVGGLFRNFEPSGEPLTLAARLSGNARSAWPDGPPEGAEPADAHLSAARGPVNIVVVADADMVHDAVWARRQETGGQRLVIPNADNANFTVNMLDALAGSAALIDLRGRTVRARPFERVENLRRAAEQAYLQREQSLMDRLKTLTAHLDELARRETAGADFALSGADSKALTQARADLIQTRRELREVRRVLRAEIDQLEAVLKAVNILAAPAVLTLIGLIAAATGRTRRARAVRTA